MAEYKNVVVQVLAISDPKPVGTGSKHVIECKDAAGNILDFDIWADNEFLPTLQVNNVYDFRVNVPENSKFNPTIYKVLPGSAEAMTASQPQVKPEGPSWTAKDVLNQAVQSPAQSARVATSKQPEFNRRFDQWNMHARTAQMQATERVGHYVQLFIAGKLSLDGAKPPDVVSKQTVENWYSEEITRYWNESKIEQPSDAFGDLLGGE
jgi:hypothetical protein